MNNAVKQIYNVLHKTYGKQGWWPIINDKTLLCEYHTGAPKNDAERFEICIGAILAQGTQWHPNVVRAIQQLKLGRELTKNELEVIKKAEMLKAKISEMPRKITKTAMLAQNTSWKNVEKALANLRRAKTLNNKALEKMPAAKLARLIKPAGYYNQKAKKLKEFARFYLALKGKEPKREKLLEVWGVGPETADSILLYAYNKPHFVVDSYTKRILSRLGICKNAEKCSYDELQQLFHKKLLRNAKLFNEFHALLVELGKRSCGKRMDAKSCKGCAIGRFC